MTGERPARPCLATLICLYEIAIVLLAIVTRSFVHWLRVAHPSAYHPTPFSQIVASELSYAMALCAGILLWRMHRAAAPLLAVRACITLVFYISALAHLPPRLAPLHGRVIHHLTAIYWSARAFGFGIVLLNAAIAWYVYNVTSPRRQRAANRAAAPVQV
jgi:hypothetical protein